MQNRPHKRAVMNDTACRFCLIVVAAVLAAPAFAFPKGPSFLGCTNPDDCAMDECCVLGMSRYSVPECKPLGAEGETCRPRGEDDQPRNVTVSYPDGTSADLTHVHTVVCPCAGGLECSDGMACAGLDGAGRLVLREDYTDVDEINHL